MLRLWPDILQDFHTLIKAALVADGHPDVPVFLGKALRVPNCSGVYIYRGDIVTPGDVFCEIERFPVMVEVFADVSSSYTGTDNTEAENTHVLESWKQLAHWVHMIQELQYGFQVPRYAVALSQHVTDGCQFHPMSGELLEFSVTHFINH